MSKMQLCLDLVGNCTFIDRGRYCQLGVAAAHQVCVTHSESFFDQFLLLSKNVMCGVTHTEGRSRLRCPLQYSSIAGSTYALGGDLLFKCPRLAC